MRFLCLIALLCSFAFSQTAGESIPWKREGFDPNVLMRGDLPDNFSVHHVFTFGMAANSWGYAHSGGAYTSIMEYYISPNVTLSAGVGFSTVFWSKSPYDRPDPLRDRTMQPELNIPFVALDWRVSDNVNVHMMFSDGSYCDAFFCESYYPYRPYGMRPARRPVQRNAIFKP